MSYRVCMTPQPRFIQIEEPHKWKEDQINAEYPKTSGILVPVTNLFLTSLLSNPAPNMSLVFESGTGSVGRDGSPIGCYGSVHNNESDIALMPVEYPIKDYDKVDPVQVIYEGPLNIVSLYKVDDKESIEYADLLVNSLKSFDMTIWSVIILTFFVFTGLLVLWDSYTPARLPMSFRDILSHDWSRIYKLRRSIRKANFIDNDSWILLHPCIISQSDVD